MDVLGRLGLSSKTYIRIFQLNNKLKIVFSFSFAIESTELKKMSVVKLFRIIELIGTKTVFMTRHVSVCWSVVLSVINS